MESCDVCIVGGGPAGSSCAWRLRHAGLDVLVLDKKIFPRDKVCAGWITPAVIEALRIDPEKYNQGRVFQAIRGFSTSRMGGMEVETLYEKPVSYGIRRCEFDHYLLQRSGARLRLGEAVKTMRRQNNQWIVNEDITTPLVIGAGGHFCPVATILGASLGSSERVIAAQEIEFEMDQHQMAETTVQSEVPELYFCSDLKGYGWCFRKGNFLNVGLGREDHHKLSGQVEAFCQFLQHKGRLPRNIPKKFNGHAYLLYTHAPREVLDDATLLIGDAAGLAYPQSGEGIRPAVESGLMAADVVLACAGNYQRQNLESYRALLITCFGRRRAKKGVADLMPSKSKEFLAGKLMATHWFSRRVVLDRWFLHVNQPALPSG